MHGREPLLSLRDVVRSYGGARVLDRVSFAMHAGEFVCLMGPNGAGKTTLFQILAGLLRADSGRIVVLGSDLSVDHVRYLAGLGLVFQSPTLDPELTVAANLAFHARLHGMRRRDYRSRMAEELARVGLADRLNHRVAVLSGGNRRRVELARALLHDPRLLLMDEPTVGLDPASRADILDHVRRRCHEDGRAALWATHLVDEAEQSDRVVVLHQGRVRADGPPAAIIEAERVASFREAFFRLTASPADCTAPEPTDQGGVGVNRDAVQA